jgi:hypothetical protein
MRGVLIEVKAAAPRQGGDDPPDGLRHVLGPPAWDQNNRAAAWLVMDSPAPTHRHVGDAVELMFDGPSPKATFVPAGTVHAGPAPSAGARAYIFEIK